MGLDLLRAPDLHVIVLCCYYLFTLNSKVPDGMECLFHICVFRSRTVSAISGDSINISIASFSEVLGMEYNREEMGF